jgi:hypothetical protein
MTWLSGYSPLLHSRVPSVHERWIASHALSVCCARRVVRPKFLLELLLDELDPLVVLDSLKCGDLVGVQRGVQSEATHASSLPSYPG